MFTTYTYIWQNCNSVLPYTGRMRGNPASGVPDSKIFDPTFVLDDKFDPSQLANFVSDDELELMAAALALVEAGVGEASKATGTTPDELSPWGERGRSLMTRGHR